jgi:hypothetical protein
MPVPEFAAEGVLLVDVVAPDVGGGACRGSAGRRWRLPDCEYQDRQRPVLAAANDVISEETSAVSAEGQMTGLWKPIADYVEPNWDKVGDMAPLLFWRRHKGAVFGYMRDGELFDAKWVYVCDANKATHFSEVLAPDDKVVDLNAFRTREGERQG